jgi:hypothetical protein
MLYNGNRYGEPEVGLASSKKANDYYFLARHGGFHVS